MRFVLLLTGLFCCGSMYAQSANLLEVYEQALSNDPGLQKSIFQTLAVKENVSINFASFLPSINFISASTYCNNLVICNNLSLVPQQNFQISATETLTFSQFAAFSGAKIAAKKADVELEATTQNLILNVSKYYLTILEVEENFKCVSANRESLRKQLYDVKQQFKVGLKTKTDVYTAQAAFDSASANLMAVATKLEDERENLRAITEKKYLRLKKINFSQIQFSEENVEIWLDSAIKHNKIIKAAQLANQISLTNIKQLATENLPVLNFQLTDNISFNHHFSNKTFSMSISFPLFSGEQIVAATRQAKYNYQASFQQLENVKRSVTTSVRQNYSDIISGIRTLAADELTIKSTERSLNEMRKKYLTGTVTLIEVLNQHENLLRANLKYSADRYAYIKNLLTLKLLAGNLSSHDLLVF